MIYQVHLFHIDRDAKPTELPASVGSFEVTADTHDGVRAAALTRLQAEGKTVRSLSFLADGGLAAVVTEPPPAPSSVQIRRATGGR